MNGAPVGIARTVLATLAVLAVCVPAPGQPYERDAKDDLQLDSSVSSARARVEEARRRLDELRDNATADDYRTIRVQDKNGHATFRRVPTEEFAARIERAERELDTAEAKLKELERSLY